MVEAHGGCVSEFREPKVSANENAGGAYGCVFSHLPRTPQITGAYDALHSSHPGAYYCCETRGEASIERRVWDVRLRVVDGAERGT